ncbi:Predicted dehydrogenase [Sphingomonas laterariae]|uniref:Predicted dehydrogenase n=1 Tax=Edaphosphingomonas laterariae TaxID=861865 RepID=A0A239BF86_9SPHN|nr:Gfo/Idh/MocA family oxidoreductase [Sphingomonas laterariae]SNS06181.1 Predicted dehydrogenase [Sphingomonas laterariae]
MSSQPPLRVGIVGANPDYGWGSGVHCRVLQRLPGFALQAVCTTREDSARAAAERFGAALHFTDALDLARHPEIDLVSICVKAPFHHDIAEAALRAGKHVYCEWPLALTAPQARDLAALSATAGTKAMIGLHLRGTPAMRAAARLIAEGYVGTVFSVTLTARLFGPMMRAMAMRAGGTTLLSIYGGHLIDALDHYFGGIATMACRSAIHLPPVDETGSPIDRDAADHLQFHGSLQNGAMFNVDLAGVSMTGMGCEWRVDGHEGTLILSTRDASLPAIEALALSGGRHGAPITPIAITPELECAVIPATPDRYPAYPGSSASREALSAIGNLYTELREAIRQDGPVSPDFARAAEIQNLLARMEDMPPTPAQHAAGVAI